MNKFTATNYCISTFLKQLNTTLFYIFRKGIKKLPNLINNLIN